MRSRLAITLMLVCGFAFTGTGAGLAASGLGSNASTSSEAQYPPPKAPTTQNTPAAPDEPWQPTIGGQPDVAGGGGAPTKPSSGVAGESGSGSAPAAPAAPAGDVAGVQEARQLGVETGNGELPFTGFAAIPVLLLGLVLVASGLVLGRRSRGATQL